METGYHLTVPTVMSETHSQAEDFAGIRPATIDNEIGYIARELALFNEQAKEEERAHLHCIHFVTDYLRTTEGQQEAAPYDLATNGLDANTVYKRRDQAFYKAASIVAIFVRMAGRVVETALLPGPREDHARKLGLRVLRTVRTRQAGSAAFQDKRADIFATRNSLGDSDAYTAINTLLGIKRYQECSDQIMLEVAVIEQKYGLLNQARVHIDYALSSSRLKPTSILALEFLVLDLKVTTQEGRYNLVAKNHKRVESLIKDSNNPELSPLLYGIHHRAGVAYAILGKPAQSAQCFRDSMALSEQLPQGHAQTTCRYNQAITQLLRDVDNQMDSPLKEVIDCQLAYLEQPTDRAFWQANKLKSCLHCLFAEAAILLRRGDATAYYRLAVANLLVAKANSNAWAEGYAELLALIPEENIRKTIRLAMQPDAQAKNSFQRAYLASGPYLTNISPVIHILGDPSGANWRILRERFAEWA